MKKIVAALGIAGTIAASSLALAPAASADNCDRVGLNAGYRGVYNTAIKSTTSPCRDVQVVSATAGDPQAGGDYYAGLYNNNGNWTWGSAGYMWINNGSYSVDQYILLSNVAGGTEYGVAEYNNGFGGVMIAD